MILAKRAEKSRIKERQVIENNRFNKGVLGFVVVVSSLFCACFAQSFSEVSEYDMSLIKQEIINNYMNSIAVTKDTFYGLDKSSLPKLTLPNCYRPYLELERLDSSRQWLMEDSIVLFEYSSLGVALKYVEDSFRKVMEPAYIIENQAYSGHSTSQPHRGLVGFEKPGKKVLFFTGPFTLHDARWLTVARSLSDKNIANYLSLIHYTKEFSNLRVSRYSGYNQVCASYKIGNEEWCTFFGVDSVTREIDIDTRDSCVCR